MAQSDFDKVQTWLQQQGFSIDSVARSRNMIRFSGTAGQVEQAFQTQMHYYTVDGAKHFAPSTALTLPSALASGGQRPCAISTISVPEPMIIASQKRARPARVYVECLGQRLLCPRRRQGGL